MITLLSLIVRKFFEYNLVIFVLRVINICIYIGYIPDIVAITIPIPQEILQIESIQLDVLYDIALWGIHCVVPGLPHW